MRRPRPSKLLQRAEGRKSLFTTEEKRRNIERLLMADKPAISDWSGQLRYHHTLIEEIRADSRRPRREQRYVKAERVYQVEQSQKWIAYASYKILSG